MQESETHHADQTAISKLGALVATTVLIMLGMLVLYINTFEMTPSYLPGYPGDAFFPRLLLAFTSFFGAILIIGGTMALMRRDADDGAASATFTMAIGETILVSIVVLIYLFLLDAVGFEIMTTLFVTVLLAPRLLIPWRKALPIAFGVGLLTTTLLYLAFGLGLKVFLPLRFLPLYLY